MGPMPNAVESFRTLAEHLNTYILSTSPWLNPGAAMHKVEWVQKHFGSGKDSPAYKRLIFSQAHSHRRDFISKAIAVYPAHAASIRLSSADKKNGFLES